MPFSSLCDPGDLARAGAALYAAWDEIKSSVPDGFKERLGDRSPTSIVCACPPQISLL